MCGVCGLVGASEDEATVRSMLARMVHRGPDDEGLWRASGVIFGHRRLAIVDLSPDGHQPMVTDDGAVAAVVNGEIYNYPDLRTQYERRGIRFRSHCDSEVVLHAYRADGVEAFASFNGMFAFGLWDANRRKLVLARDRLGIKPIYFYHDKDRGRLAFASEIKALLAAGGRSTWRIDPEALGQYLTYQNMFGDRTLFEDIRLLPPGHVLEYEEGRLKIRPFWHPIVGGQSTDSHFESSVQTFKTTFSDAVRRHLMSDVPVAAYLSAGLDSTLVAATAAPMTGESTNTYTGHFADGGWYDEGAGAGLVAASIGSVHSSVRIGSSDFRDQFDDVVRSLDEPRMGMGAFSQYIVAARASRDRKVILTGHGGDELFSGYPVFKAALLARYAREGNAAAAKAILGVRPSEVPHLGYFAKQASGAEEGRHFLPVLFTRRQQRRVLRADLWSAVSEFHPSSALQTIASEARSPYERILLTYLRLYLPGLLVVEDKISMAQSLESRTPYLDNALVDLSLALPEETKLHGGTLKSIVRSAAQDVLPDALLKMPKRGFPTPLRLWLREDLAGWMEERVSGEGSVLRRIFKPEFLAMASKNYRESWYRSFRPLDEIATHRMWMLLSLESWLRQTEEHYGVAISAT